MQQKFDFLTGLDFQWSMNECALSFFAIALWIRTESEIWFKTCEKVGWFLKPKSYMTVSFIIIKRHSYVTEDILQIRPKDNFS